MAGAHCLEECLALLATDFADDDIFRPLSHGSTQELVMLISPRPAVSNESRVTLGIQLGWGSSLPGVFQADDLCHRGNEQGDRV